MDFNIFAAILDCGPAEYTPSGKLTRLTSQREQRILDYIIRRTWRHFAHQPANNPYAAALQQATADKARKWTEFEQREQWWLDAERYFDLVDIGLSDDKDEILRAAHYEFSSLPPPHKINDKRIDLLAQDDFGTDAFRDAIINLLKEAIGSGALKILTNRQEQADRLAQEAHEKHVNPSAYVAEHLGINRHSAYKLIKRAEMKKMETLGAIYPYIDRTMYTIDLSGLNDEIKNTAKYLPRHCAVCGKQTPGGMKALCKACDRKFRYLEDFTDTPITPADLARYTHENSSAHWKKAREIALAKRMVSLEDLEAV